MCVDWLEPRTMRSRFLPNRVLVISDADAIGRHAQRVPLVVGKRPVDGRTTAYVCEEGRCERPTSDPRTFATQLDRLVPYDIRLLHDEDAETGHQH